MYDLINQHARTLVATIPPDHITEYEWLIQNVGQATTDDYQKRYRKYWAMNAALLSPTFYAAYFATMSAATRQTQTLTILAQSLHAVSTNSKGRQSLQFSFATKHLHMMNQRLPIYSSEVAAFYFFREPAIKKPHDPQDLQHRIAAFVALHTFLRQEYARVLQHHLLSTAIQEFRFRLNPKRFTDEKIVDSLIWAFVAFLRKGALPKGQIVYR